MRPHTNPFNRLDVDGNGHVTPLDVLNLIDSPDTPNDPTPPVDEPVDEPIDEPVDEPIVELTDETRPEPEREGGSVLGVGATIDPLTRAAGDSNRDGVFDSSDLVVVFAAGEYEDSISGNSTFETGDWNGDGEFTSSDLVFAFRFGAYGRGARGLAVEAEGTSADTLSNASLNLRARDRLFEDNDELWALRDLLEDDDL